MLPRQYHSHGVRGSGDAMRVRVDIGREWLARARRHYASSYAARINLRCWTTETGFFDGGDREFSANARVLFQELV